MLSAAHALTNGFTFAIPSIIEKSVCVRRCTKRGLADIQIPCSVKVRLILTGFYHRLNKQNARLNPAFPIHICNYFLANGGTKVKPKSQGCSIQVFCGISIT